MQFFCYISSFNYFPSISSKRRSNQWARPIIPILPFPRCVVNLPRKPSGPWTPSWSSPSASVWSTCSNIRAKITEPSVSCWVSQGRLFQNSITWLIVTSLSVACTQYCSSLACPWRGDIWWRLWLLSLTHILPLLLLCCIQNGSISQIPQCIRHIAQCTISCAHLCYKVVHCVIWDWCIQCCGKSKILGRPTDHPWLMVGWSVSVLGGTSINQ